MLTDSHCHLYLNGLADDLEAVLERAMENGVMRLICVGIDLTTSLSCLELSESYSGVFAAAGIHPHEAGDVPDNYLHRLEELLRHPKMVAVGEIGLDYYRNRSDPAVQKKIFQAQIELARSLNKPIIFHNRNADRDVISVLKESNAGRGVAHCFSSDLNTAQAFIDLGFYISFAGNLTFKNSSLSEVARALPLESILIETDAPFLSPAPFRGKRNEPARARRVAEALAEIRGRPFEEVAESTNRNTETLFALPVT